MLSIETLGSRIAYLRTRAGLTQRQLMDTLKIDNLSRYERNERRPSIDTLVAIAKYFNVSTDWLLFGSKEHTPWGLQFSKETGVSEFSQTFSNRCKAEELKQDIAKLQDLLITYCNLIKYFEAFALEDPIQTQNTTGTTPIGCPLGLIPIPQTNPPLDYIFLMKDDSMAPIFPLGTGVFVRSQEELENGDLGIFEVNGEMICRRFRQLEDHLLLEPFNEAYRAHLLQFHGRPQLPYRIIGKVYQSS